MSDPKADCEELLNAIMPFAQRSLTKHGEFHPFGMAMDPDGQVALVAVYEREFPNPHDLIRGIKDVFRKGARSGAYKATALAYNSSVTLPGTSGKSDAITVHLDHRDDQHSVEIFYPYTLTRKPYTLTRKTLEIGAPFGQRGGGEIFTR